MKIELKKISFSERLSQETNAFAADVYIDGKKAATAQNQGQGGPTDIHPYPGMKDLVDKAETYCKGLPKYQDLDMDLEFKIDLLLEEELKKRHMAKAYKRLEKKTETHIILLHKTNEDIIKEFHYGSKGKKVFLTQVKPATLKAHLEKILAENTEYKLFNTNINEDGTIK